jgi:hypothetical protein
MTDLPKSIFFNLYIHDEICKKGGTLPEEVNLDIFYRDMMTMSLKLAKEIFYNRDIVRYSLESGKYPNGKEASQEVSTALLKNAEKNFERLFMLRKFIIVWYDIPELPANVRFQDELHDELGAMRQDAKILTINSEEEMMETMKNELSEKEDGTESTDKSQ